MVSFDKAIELVRKRFPHDYIIEGFEYDNEYVFRILSHEYKNMHTNQSHLVSVDKNGEVNLFDVSKAFNDLDGYGKAQNKAIKIDEVR